MRLRLLCPALISVLGALPVEAADAPGATKPAFSGDNFAGPRFSVGGQRAVTIRGMLDFDVLSQGQYLSGNSKESDHRSNGNIRAELGAKVRLDEQVSVVITLAYEAEAGDNTADDPTGSKRSGYTVVDDAYVELNDVLNFESVGMKLGRQPVAWNLREGHGAFLYDSAANHPRVTSWDGGRASWNVVEGVVVNPMAFSTPADSTLYGAEVNWQPARSGDTRVFITGMAMWENNAPESKVNPVGAAGPNQDFSGDGKATFTTASTGRKLTTYYLGTDFYAGNVELFGEGAIQRGTERGNVKYNGYGMSAGLDWHLYPAQALVVGLQGDYLSGDRDPNDATNNAFVNTWESVNDTYIVENDKYGELSRYLQGNLEAVKLHAGVAFDQRNKVRLDAIYAYYKTAQPVSGNGQDDARAFGQEGDITLTWKYTYDATIRLFAAGFLPNGAFEAKAPSATPDRNLVYLLGANLTVLF